MKNKLITTIFILCFTICLNAQTKRITISETKVAKISAKYFKSVNLKTNDTLYILFLGFQNEEYKNITDIKAVYFNDFVDKFEFLEDLKMASKELENKTEMSWRRKNYTIAIYDFVKQLYLYEKSSAGNGYTILNKKEVDQLIQWLESFEFGKG